MSFYRPLNVRSNVPSLEGVQPRIDDSSGGQNQWIDKVWFFQNLFLASTRSTWVEEWTTNEDEKQTRKIVIVILVWRTCKRLVTIMTQDDELQPQPTDGVHLKFEKKETKFFSTVHKSEINGKINWSLWNNGLNTRNRLFWQWVTWPDRCDRSLVHTFFLCVSRPLRNIWIMDSDSIRRSNLQPKKKKESDLEYRKVGGCVVTSSGCASNDRLRGKKMSFIQWNYSFDWNWLFRVL